MSDGLEAALAATEERVDAALAAVAAVTRASNIDTSRFFMTIL